LKLSNLGWIAFVAAVAAVQATQTQERVTPPDTAVAARPISAGQGLIETVVYEREVFTYPAAARPDPFRSLLLDGDLGIRIEDLTLRGVVYHPDQSRSVAIMTQAGTNRRIQARVGESVGPLRILGIYPERVEIVIEELGVARRETLRLVAPEPGADE
jgi:hypothetical protein